jgi:hypothetical protein
VELAKKKHGRGMITLVFAAATGPLEYSTARAVSRLSRKQNVESLSLGDNGLCTLHGVVSHPAVVGGEITGCLRRWRWGFHVTVSFNQPSGGKADVAPAVAMICVEGGGMASVALSGPSGGKATSRGMCCMVQLPGSPLRGALLPVRRLLLM